MAGEAKKQLDAAMEACFRELLATGRKVTQEDVLRLVRERHSDLLEAAVAEELTAMVEEVASGKPPRDPLDSHPGQSLESMREELEAQKRELQALKSVQERLAPHAEGREHEPIGPILEEIEAAEEDRARKLGIPGMDG